MKKNSVSTKFIFKLQIEATFGEEIGGLLKREAEREESFASNNVPDTQYMAKLTSEAIPDPNNLREARRNDREIRSNIPKLIKLLAKHEDKRAKLEKEFGSIIRTSDIKSFTYQFSELKRLWLIHLTTSKEDVDSTKKQTAELEKKTQELEVIVKKKEEDLEKRLDH